MAKPATLQIRLVSTADTGYFYVTKKNPRTKPVKLQSGTAQYNHIRVDQADQCSRGAAKPVLKSLNDAVSDNVAVDCRGSDLARIPPFARHPLIITFKAGY